MIIVRAGYQVRRVKLLAVATSMLVWGMISAGCSPSNSMSPQIPVGEGGQGASGGGEIFLTNPSDLAPVVLAEGEKLNVVATTNIVADVVAKVGGDAITLTALIPFGADPHTYEPTPGDYRMMADAHMVIINGFGLEESMHEKLDQIANNVPIVSLSSGVETLQLGTAEIGDHEGEERLHPGVDPHVWFDPINVTVWVENVKRSLGALDPANAVGFEVNADAYVGELEALDGWISDQVAQIEHEDRLLLTDHLVFGYFARRYGFQMVGAVIPAYSTVAQPSAGEIAELVDAIQRFGVRAVFVGMSTNPKLAERVSEDTGVELVPLFTGSLSETSESAGTYLDLMKYNVSEIVRALRE